MDTIAMIENPVTGSRLAMSTASRTRFACSPRWIAETLVPAAPRVRTRVPGDHLITTPMTGDHLITAPMTDDHLITTPMTGDQLITNPTTTDVAPYNGFATEPLRPDRSRRQV